MHIPAYLAVEFQARAVNIVPVHREHLLRVGGAIMAGAWRSTLLNVLTVCVLTLGFHRVREHEIVTFAYAVSEN